MVSNRSGVCYKRGGYNIGLFEHYKKKFTSYLIKLIGVAPLLVDTSKYCHTLLQVSLNRNQPTKLQRYTEELTVVALENQRASLHNR